MYGSNSSNHIDSSIVSVCDILLCRDSDLLISSKAMLMCFAEGLSSSDGSSRTSVPLVGEAVFYPDTMATALSEMCSKSNQHTYVPKAAWYALASAYSTGGNASNKEDFVKFLGRLVRNIPNDAAVFRLNSSVLNVDKVSYIKRRGFGSSKASSANNAGDVHHVALSERGTFGIQKDELVLATLNITVEYEVHLHRMNRDNTINVGVVPLRAYGIYSPTAGGAEVKFFTSFANRDKKTYCTRVPHDELGQSRTSSGYIPSVPTMDNSIGLQKSVEGFATKCLLRGVNNGSDITVRALSALSGIHGSRFVVAGHHSEAKKVSHSNKEIYEVVDRVITRLKCEDRAVANVCAQVTYTVEQDFKSNNTVFRDAKLSVVKPNSRIDGIKFLMGELRPDGLKCKLGVNAKNTPSITTLFKNAKKLHADGVALEEKVIGHGIAHISQEKIASMLASWRTGGDRLLTEKGVNSELLAQFAGMVLLDDTGRNVAVSVKRHVVAHRGVIVGAASGSFDNRALDVHDIEEHFVCAMETTTEQELPLHVCASYVVHDYEGAGPHTCASLRGLHVGMRSTGKLDDAAKDIKEGLLVNSDFVWFDASSHEVTGINCKKFAAEIGKIEVADGTINLLPGTPRLYKVTGDKSSNATQCLVSECLGPVITRKAELLLEDRATAYAELLGNPTSCEIPETESVSWLHDGNKVIFDAVNPVSKRSVYMVPHHDLGASESSTDRKRLLTKLSEKLGSAAPVSMLESVVNLAQRESAFLKFMREAISVTMLRFPCDVHIIDSALHISASKSTTSGASNGFTILRHMLLEPKAWWTATPKKVHAVLGYNVGVAREEDLRECLVFSNASIHLRSVEATTGALDLLNDVQHTVKNGKTDTSLFHFSATNMLAAAAPELRVLSSDVLSAVQSYHQKDRYTYIMQTSSSNTTTPDTLLEDKVKYCIERFVSLHGASEVFNVTGLPLQCVGNSTAHFARNKIQVEDLSEHLLRKSECSKLASHVKAMLEASHSSKVCVEERGVINGQETLDDPETLLGSLKTGMMLCRSLVVEENDTGAMTHLVFTCDVKSRRTGNETTDTIAVSELFFRVLTDKKLSLQFHTAPVSFFGNFQSYNRFVSSLIVALDLSEVHLVSNVAVEQGQKTGNKGLSARKRKGLHLSSPLQEIGMSSAGASKNVEIQEKEENNNRAHRDAYYARRCANLLDITFERSLPPSIDEIKRAIKFLVHVVSDGSITIAEIAALNKSTLYTNYSKINDTSYSVTHSAKVETDNHGDLSVQFTYKASKVVDDTLHATDYIVSDAELLVKGNSASTAFDGKSGTTLKLSQNVDVSKEKWDTLVDRYNKLSATKQANSFTRKLWSGIVAVVCFILALVKNILTKLLSCLCCCFSSASSVSEYTHDNSATSLPANDTFGFGEGLISDQQRNTENKEAGVSVTEGVISGDAPSTKVSSMSTQQVTTPGQVLSA